MNRLNRQIPFGVFKIACSMSLDIDQRKSNCTFVQDIGSKVACPGSKTYGSVLHSQSSLATGILSTRAGGAEGSRAFVTEK